MTSRNSSVRVLLDVAAFHEPGADRGNGRYMEALKGALDELLKVDVTGYLMPFGPHGRFSEWINVPFRTGRVVMSPGTIYHSTSVYHLPAFGLGRTIVSIHDIVPLEYEEYRKTGVKAWSFFSLAKRVRTVLTLSEHTARRVTDRLGVDPSRIVVAPIPIMPRRTCQRRMTTGLGRAVLDRGPYVLAIHDAESVDPRKRLPWLLGVGERLGGSGIRLVLAGRGTERLSEPAVQTLGRVSDSERADLLHNASCFLYTSAYEGQGLPPQEALAQGTPVVAMRNTSLPEMLGSGAHWVEEQDNDECPPLSASRQDPEVDALTSGVLRVSTDRGYREDLSRNGVLHVSQFTMSRFVSALAKAYEVES